MNDFLQSLRNGQADKQRTPKTRKNFDNSYHYSSGPRFNTYGGGYPNTRNPQMKRPPMQGPVPHQQPGNQMPMPEDQNLMLLTEVIENLGHQVETLVKNQEYMITISERQADLLQRQADAIEMVMAHLNIGPDAITPRQPAFENHYVSSQEPEDELDGTVEELLKAEMEADRQQQDSFQEPLPAATPVMKKRRKVVSAPQPKTGTGTGSQQGLLPREEIMDIINSMRDEGATYDQVARRLIDLGQPTFSGRGEWHAQTIHRLCSRK